MIDPARLDRLAKAADFFTPFTGSFNRADLQAACDRELSTETVRLPKSIVHIISGNTPHAAHQSLLNGLLTGAKNRLKLPSDALPDFRPPPQFEDEVETSRILPDHWLPEADVLIVYGTDATIRHFRNLCPLETIFIGHGPRLGIALIDDPSPEAATLAARDIGEFDQQGCLSLQTIFVDDPPTFAPLLAQAMATYEKENPRGKLTASESGAITNLRAETTYRLSQEPKNYGLWHSPRDTSWTIIYENLPGLSLSPGNRTVFLKPHTPFDPADPGWRVLSGIGIFPFKEETDLPSPRIFSLGNAQSPPALWAHDGIPPLASLVKHQTITPISKQQLPSG